MGALDRIGKRILETVEERTGREIVPSDRMEILESAEGQNRVLRKTLDFIGFTLFNYSGSQPSPYRMPNDMLPMARIFAASQSLRAWIDDPMAGQQVDLYVSFIFGRGVPKPQAHDDEVQDLLDETWADEANKRILTSFEKLTEKGVDAAIQCNVYFTFFDDGEDGAVRVSMLSFENVLDVVRHPKDKFRILYYKVVEKEVVYDYAKGAYVTPPGDAGKPQHVYYEAYGAFDEDNPVMVAQDDAAGGKAALEPPSNLLRRGKVVHLAFNKTSEMGFGVPRMRRLLRWWEAYNSVMESHVNRMKAMASIYMKATVRGDQGQLDKLAMMATGRSSPFGSAQDLPGPHSHRPPGPTGPGIIGQNESLNYEPMKIDSGAGDVAQSVPQLRAQVSGVFPPTYYGQDPGGLAGGNTVELPVLKFIEREQEQWAGVFRKLAESRINAAIRVGDLTEYRDATADEEEEIAAAEESGMPLRFEFNGQGQVKRDLGFDLSLPSPLKRVMGDLVTAAVTTATAVDPNAQNPELSRWLFGFILAEAFDVEDPQRIVDQVLPRHAAVAAAEDEAQIDPTTGQPIPADTATITGADGKQHPPDNPYGAKVQSPNPEEREVQEAAVDRGRRRAAAHASAARRRDIGEAFDEEVGTMVREQLSRLGDLPAVAATNGHVAGGDE